MRAIPDGTVDCVDCDMPFAKTENIWDVPLDLEALWKQYKRVVKPNGAIILFALFPFAANLALSNLATLKR
jgi:site-specific DNA-methyltransferase (adenine-specific)